MPRAIGYTRVSTQGQADDGVSLSAQKSKKQEAACRALAEVPGIGKLAATALVATIGDAKTFRSGREFASFLGLVPRQSGTEPPRLFRRHPGSSQAIGS